mgnify:CR=1 FL=1
MFFGRADILRRFDLAMVDEGSDDRALFFTGTRGSGKTALLEQLSIRASEKGRKVVDLGPENTVEQLVSELAGFDESTTTVNPQASVSVLGRGGGVSAGSVSKTKRIGRERLQSLLIEACRKAKRGMLVTVDEVQKVPIDDVSSLCNAFQMASRKGHDVMLAVAGLPYAHPEIVEHEGCTYLRRASHEELALFTWDEASDAFSKAFSLVDGLAVDRVFLDELNRASYGQPYLMQLLGYHLVSCVNEGNPGKRHDVTAQEVDAAMSLAVLAYERRALKPLVEELPRTERRYLSAMAECLDDDRLARTSAVAERLGMTQKSLSQARSRLMGNGIIAAPERGAVMFCIPYLADFVTKEEATSTAVEIARMRKV